MSLTSLANFVETTEFLIIKNMMGYVRCKVLKIV
jgi:hypothetical protein